MPTDNYQIEPFRDQFWRQVHRALTDEFDWQAQRASKRIDEAIDDLGDLSEDAQLLFFHAEPLHVAEDFADRRSDADGPVSGAMS